MPVNTQMLVNTRVVGEHRIGTTIVPHMTTQPKVLCVMPGEEYKIRV